MHYFGKTLHIGAYAFLTVLGGSQTLTRRGRWLLLVGLSLHGCATEFLQGFVERGASWWDVLRNYAGIVVGVLVGWYWWKDLFRKKSNPVA
jgi:VanZ family protein